MLYHLRTNTRVRSLLLILLAAAPVPAVIKGAPYQIQRASGLLIVISLLAGCGLAALWHTRRGIPRLVAAALALVMALQFAGFYADYFDNYRISSASAYDPTAFRDAAELMVAEDQQSPVARVYLPTGFYDVSAKWRFYTTKHDRPALWRRTEYYSGAIGELAQAPPDSLAVLPLTDDGATPVAGWRTVQIVRGLMDVPTLALLRRIDG